MHTLTFQVQKPVSMPQYPLVITHITHPVRSLVLKAAEARPESRYEPTWLEQILENQPNARTLLEKEGALVKGDPSVLADTLPKQGEIVDGHAAVLTEVFKVARDITKSGAGTIADFMARDSETLDPHQRAAILKQATVAAQQGLYAAPQPPVSPAYGAPQPSPPQLSANLHSFAHQPPATMHMQPPTPHAGPVTNSQMPAAAPGHATMTGVNQRPVGLDRPCDTRAAAVPGLEGSPATNVIDQQGGLDPRGLKVDGNNAAGQRKLAPGMTMKQAELSEQYAGIPGWLAAPLMAFELNQEKQAATLDVTGGDNMDSQDRATNSHRFITTDELKTYGDKAKADRIKELQDSGHGRRICDGCGSIRQCRCMKEHHSIGGSILLDIPDRHVASCYDCESKSVDRFHTDLKAALGQDKEAADKNTSTDTDVQEWIGVDLDGTLAQYDGWQGEDHIGEPVEKMVDRVKSWLAKGKKVKVFTARVADDPDGKIADTIKDWTEEHVGQRLEVTNQKDHGMVALWDDRAHRVEHNTGVKLAHTSQFARISLEPKAFDPAFLQSGEIQELLASLGMRSTPDGKVVDGTKLQIFSHEDP